MTDADVKQRDLPTADQLAAELRRTRYGRNYRRTMLNTVGSLLVVAALAVLIAVALLPVLRVTGSSMSPTLQNNEFVICERLGGFQRGDIVAFYYNSKILMKRVIATGGDVIDIAEDGTVTVNGEVLDEPYVSEAALGECDITLPYQVPETRIFVMGDNRTVSIDSRSSTIGSISEEFVLGKVVLRIWPLQTIGTF